MSIHSIPAEFASRCVETLRDAWPGIDVIRFEVSVGHPNTDYPGSDRLSMTLVVAGPEEVIVRHGLLTAREAGSIPPCGVCNRGGWQVRRGKTRTRLESWGYDHILDRLAPVLVPALVWRPPEPA